MNRILISKIFNFEAAHALKKHPGKCRNIHGHSYKLEISVAGVINNDTGMFMDLADLKSLIEEKIISLYDHGLILENDHFTEEELSFLRNLTGNIILLPFTPTCENMLIQFADILNPYLPESVTLQHMKLYETAGSFAEWYPS